jgi:hypothetical protein
MNTFVGGPHVPVTVRTLAVRSLAANTLARGGSIEYDTGRARERAVNWLALAMLLAAWNVEARLDDAPPASSLVDRPLTVFEPAVGGFDWTEPRSPGWMSGTARQMAPCGAGLPGARALADGAVRTLRLR